MKTGIKEVVVRNTWYVLRFSPLILNVKLKTYNGKLCPGRQSDNLKYWIYSGTP